MYGIEVGFAILASLASGQIGSRWGRKAGLILCALSGLLGSGLQMIAAWAAQVVGRAIMGAAIGFAGNFAITYWSEAAPVRLRGVIVIFYNLFVTVPSFIGSCVDEGTFRLDNRWSYRAPLLVTMAAPLLLLLLIRVVPESPRKCSLLSGAFSTQQPLGTNPLL
jgi:SP family sugar:H+ symporter-like MFS transporter